MSRDRWRVSARPPKGKDGPYWQLRFYPPAGEGRPGKPGKPYQRSARTTHEDEAHALAAQEEARLNSEGVRSPDGLDARLPTGRTLVSIMERYVTVNSTLKPLTVRKYRQSARRLAPLLDGKPLSTLALVQARDELLLEGLAPLSINKHLVACKTAWCWAAERRLVSASWPALRSLRAGHTELRPPTPAEVAAILAAARDYVHGHYHPLFLLALSTGGRIGAVTQLLERDLDRERGEVTFRAEITKTRTARVVPVPLEVLAQIPVTERDAPLFVGRRSGEALGAGSTYNVWKRVLARAGIDAVAEKLGGFHAARRSYITRCFAAEVPLNTIMGLVGHHKADTTLAYARNAPPVGGRDAAAKVAEALGLTAPPAASLRLVPGGRRSG